MDATIPHNRSVGLRRRVSGITPVAWVPPNSRMQHPEWLAAGRRLGGISRCNQWWLGDWLRYGTAKWGEKYVEAARVTGYDVRSLANMASIAGAFQISRRRENLTWSHHAVVAALDCEEQDRWLDIALTERFSVADLRIEVRSAERLPAGSRARALSTSPHKLGITCPRCGFEISRDDRVALDQETAG